MDGKYWKTREDGRWKMDEKRTNKIRSVRDLKVYRKAQRAEPSAVRGLRLEAKNE